MNRRMVFYTIGKLAQITSVLLLLPLFVSIIYKEQNGITAFLITSVVSLGLGVIARVLFKPSSRVIFAKEGFAIVSLSWFYLSVIGALPFVLSGEIPNIVDAIFETVSGFTTTGASIIPNISAISSKGILFWRSFTHWIGGMGILVFVIAVLPGVSDRSIHILRAEVPGPVVGKLVPKIKDTAKILYLIYIVLTALQILLLYLGDMSLYESVIYTFGTAGTGGFGIKPDSVASYSHYSQWVITVFMLVFGINFNLFYFLLLRNFRQTLKSEELWSYLGIAFVSIVFISLNTFKVFGSVQETIRNSAFTVASILTTTGYATTDFNLWPVFSKSLLLILMLIGGCAGSTAGGIKVTRVMLIFKCLKREFKKLLHPRTVASVRFEKNTVEESVVHGTCVYLAVYIVCLLAVFLLISFEPFGIETNLSAAISCFNNVGPGLAEVGPAGSYAAYSAFSKILLSFAMLMGRLEIFPILLFFSPATWKKK